MKALNSPGIQEYRLCDPDNLLISEGDPQDPQRGAFRVIFPGTGELLGVLAMADPGTSHDLVTIQVRSRWPTFPEVAWVRDWLFWEWDHVLMLVPDQVRASQRMFTARLIRPWFQTTPTLPHL